MNETAGAGAAPLELPRLVMRRASWVAVAVLLTALLLGVWSSGADIDDETRSAVALAATLARVVEAVQRNEPGARNAVALLQATGPLRHVSLTLRDAQGRVWFDSSSGDEGSASWLAWLDRGARQARAPASQEIVLHRPDGSAWSLHVAAARGSERREAMSGLAQMLALVAAGSVAMLAVMAWNMRRAFAPLRTLVQVIEQLRSGAAPDAGHLAAGMPIRELQTIAQAVHGLQRSLDEEAARRRVLSRQVLTLQEDERQRLARELHDEFGQHLTALRADATWLARRTIERPDLARVAAAVAERCGAMQQQIRGVLTRLHPLAPTTDLEAVDEPASRLAELLQDLIDGWARSATQTCAFALRLSLRTAAGSEQPWPVAAWSALRLPRELVLTLYRLSQEALTNVARHAQATQAQLELALHCGADEAVQTVAWAVSDDGIGLADPERALQRGTGLAGLKERAWVQGAELHVSPAWPERARPGLRLSARFEAKRLASR